MNDRWELIVEYDPDATIPSHPYRPCLADGMLMLGLDMWSDSEEDCQKLIDEILADLRA